MLQEHNLAEAVVDRLRRLNVVDDKSVERARSAADAEGIRIDLALFRLGLAPEADLASAYAEVCGQEIFDPESGPLAPVTEVELPLEYLERTQILPLEVDEDHLLVAMTDPLNEVQIQALYLKTGRKIIVRPARSTDIENALKRLYRNTPCADDHLIDDADIKVLRSIASDAPVVRFVDSMFSTAVKLRASDVHLMPVRGGTKLRLRIDGRLADMDPPPTKMRAAIISRLKLMARLDIAETRLPQDGRIRSVIAGRALDLRVSIAPTVDGESAVIRILDGGGERPRFESLSLTPGVLSRIKHLADRPTGVTLVVGPTGSGKTTTLYAALSHMSRPDRHLATIEDPVEYRLEGVNQVQVRPDIGFDFPQALRYLLRHDPDVVMIGEIRDSETARIGLQSALTGHPVLATLHTNDAPSAVTRLMDMGAEPFVLAAVLNGVVAQRLVRRLCPSCREVTEPTQSAQEIARSQGLTLTKICEPKGCDVCRGTGFDGRLAVAEVMTVDRAISDLIRASVSVSELRDAALIEGMKPLFHDGLLHVANGRTSFDELVETLGGPGG